MALRGMSAGEIARNIDDELYNDVAWGMFWRIQLFGKTEHLEGG